MSSKAVGHAGNNFGRNDDVLFITKKKQNKRGNNKRDYYDDASYAEHQQYFPKDQPKEEHFPSNSKVVDQLK